MRRKVSRRQAALPALPSSQPLWQLPAWRLLLAAALPASQLPAWRLPASQLLALQLPVSQLLASRPLASRFAACRFLAASSLAAASFFAASSFLAASFFAASSFASSCLESFGLRRFRRWRGKSLCIRAWWRGRDGAAARQCRNGTENLLQRLQPRIQLGHLLRQRADLASELGDFPIFGLVAADQRCGLLDRERRRRLHLYCRRRLGLRHLFAGMRLGDDPEQIGGRKRASRIQNVAKMPGTQLRMLLWRSFMVRKCLPLEPIIGP